MNNIHVTLPIDFSSGLKMEAEKARQIGEELSGEYCFAEPYPHIVIDNFLPQALIAKILSEFPSADTESYVKFEGGVFEHNKRAISPYECSVAMQNVFEFFNAAPFLQFIEGLTAIEGIIPDPYFSGGGFHEISRGGKLGVHADFRIQTQLHLHRRVNALIYLNKDWDKLYGGELELWNCDMSRCARRVAPILNRCVIFNTDADAYHGHPDPLNTPENLTRKSLALYYYTASKAVYGETLNVTTMFKARPTDPIGTRVAAQKQNQEQYFSAQQWVPPIIYAKLKEWRRRMAK